ncbi:MAG: FHA domain-containing protein [Anaerolineae bacterium]|nr:FHA domain-containing protein [Anaerolineae bacterium]
MKIKNTTTPHWILVNIIVLLLCLTAITVHAQDEPGSPLPFLLITNSDAASPPTIQLQVVGMDGQGNAIDFNGGGVVLKENGAPVDFQVTGSTPVGTLTVFLIDVPGGVSEQIPAIQQAILQYASAGNMVEGTDYVAIYKISETGPVELLAPTNFYNSVQNAFATPLEPETGATALVDSIMAMLNQMETLKPNPLMQEALVVMSDGTDVVSSQFTTTDVAPNAANLGIPIHTVWLDNAELGGLSIGRDYLAEVSSGSRGTAVQLTNPADLAQIWSRITALRNHTNLSYLMDNPVGGSLEISLNLADNPDVQATTSLEVSTTVPSVTIELPIESRIMSLPNLDNPVKLRFATTVSWLDGVERKLEAAQLVVNGTVVSDIPVQNINDFEAEVDNLVFGDNTVQVAVLDEQGIPVTSPAVNLTVQEGNRDVPQDLDAGGASGLSWLIWLVLLVALLLAAFYLVRRYDLLSKVKMPSRGGKREKGAAATASSDYTAAAYDEPLTQSTPSAKSGNQPIVTSAVPIAYLEVLEAVTRIAGPIELKASQVSLGRSPAQADIAFENDITVSRIHATLHLEGSHFRLFDERSTSGTWVNEQQVPEYGIQLMDGDEIHLGAVHLRYREA